MNTVRVDIQALCRNYKTIQALIGADCQVMAVVKADGYGHGMVEVAGALQGVGADCFGVGTAREGLRLRKAGVTGRIVVLLGDCGVSPEILTQYQLEPVVCDHKQLAELQDEVSGVLPIHLKIDCGMGRLGFSPGEIVQVCNDIGSSSLIIAGVMSHFPVADEDRELSKEQADLFAETVHQIHALGIKPLAHMANSAAILAGLVSHGMARAGLALYGYSPSSDPGFSQTVLEPVMTVCSTVLQVKEVPAGTGISYGLSQQTRRDSRLAVIAMGYADGFSRALSGCGQVLISGQFARVIGRVCMNMTVVDVTDIDSVECGDEVVVLGRQGENEISATEIADLTHTINYEILCTLGNLTPRSYC
ncbi:MAG: alanine racemase [Desulfobulbaceae bacterium]|jgi:alanine racemase|nr:alanine racemase [Desulfobulbaceae bacterium]